MCAEVEDNMDKEGEGTKEEEDHNAAMEDRDFEESLTIMSEIDEVEYEDIEINIDWDYKELEDSDWLPKAQAHHNALELVVDALKTTLWTTAKEIRELEQRMRAGQGPNDVKARAALQALGCKYSSLAKAATAALEVGDLAAENVEVLHNNMNRFHQELQDYETTAKVLNENILKVLTKMQEMSNSRNSEVRSRMICLESAMTNLHQSPLSLSPNHFTNVCGNSRYRWQHAAGNSYSGWKQGCHFGQLSSQDDQGASGQDGHFDRSI